MSLTLNQALTLSEVHQTNAFDSHGNCRVWRRNGATQTWKRSPTRYRLPLKYGLYHYDAITDQTDQNVHAPEDCPHITQAERDTLKAQRQSAQDRAAFRAEFDYLYSLGWLYFDGNATLNAHYNQTPPDNEWHYVDTHLPYRLTVAQLREY